MNKIFFSLLLVGSALFTTNADALKVSVSPSVTFRSSNQTCYPCAQRVVTGAPVMEVRSFIDPYTGRRYYQEYPVYPARVVNYYYPPARYHSHGTDFQLQFRIR
jgi:hypothetical protein